MFHFVCGELRFCKYSFVDGATFGLVMGMLSAGLISRELGQWPWPLVSRREGVNGEGNVEEASRAGTDCLAGGEDARSGNDRMNPA